MKRSRLAITVAVLSVVAFVVVFVTAIFAPFVAEPVDERPAQDARRLHAEGRNLVNDNGDIVLLEGVNAGGLFIQEDWMSPTEFTDHLSMLATLDRRFGREGRDALIEIYESAYWQTSDFDIVKEFGFNCIRLPFCYFNLEDADGNLTRFDRLDWFVDECDKRDIYLVLDLHAAYGSQNGSQTSGQIGRADLYNFKQNRDKTIILWQTIAERYRDRTIIAAFDVLNEPSGNSGNTNFVQWGFYHELYEAIREVDPYRALVFESCWEASDLPNPSLFGWENVIYSYHNYCFEYWYDTDKLIEFTNSKLSDYAALKYDVPIFVGEFTLHESYDAWRHALDSYKAAGISYALWSYKAYGETSWGIFKGFPSETIDPENDSYEEIARKWALQTTDNHTMHFIYPQVFSWDKGD